jgi:hypothetical protein
MTDPDAAPDVDKADVRAQPLLAFLPVRLGRCPCCHQEIFEDDMDEPDDADPRHDDECLG